MPVKFFKNEQTNSYAKSLAQRNARCFWSKEKMVENNYYFIYNEYIQEILFEYLFQLIKHRHFDKYLINHIYNYILPKSSLLYTANAQITPIIFSKTSFIGQLINIKEINKYNKYCNLLVEPKTKYGRQIRLPNRFEKELFAKGSGVSGCDQYDRGFAGKEHGDYGASQWVTNEITNSDYIKKDFVVDDKEELVVDEDNDVESSEDEYDYSETDESDFDEDELFEDD